MKWSAAFRRRYNAQWARKNRPRSGKPTGRPRGQVRILGCSVRPGWVPVPSVTREQAEREFLSSTDSMKRP